MSVTLEWTPGYNGGSPQSFSIAYRNIENGDEYNSGPIGDNYDGYMQYKLTEGILPDTNFLFLLSVSSSFGDTEGPHVEHATPGILHLSTFSLFFRQYETLTPTCTLFAPAIC